MLAQTVLYSQPQLYDVVPAVPCPNNDDLGSLYTSPRITLWRPILGHEIVEALPLPSQPVTDSLTEPCYVPSGMATTALRFPSRISGFQRNPVHGARASLCPRYTSYEWTENNQMTYNASLTARNYSERLRTEVFRVLRETDETTSSGQKESGRRIGERISDITYWKNEGATILKLLLEESNHLQDKKREIEVVKQELEGLLHISQECLGQREQRMGIDLVHDGAEEALLEEVEILRNCEEKLLCLKELAVKQMDNIYASQHDLEMDVKSKEGALTIDGKCYNINNFSRSLKYHGHIENVNTTFTTPETWAQVTDISIKRALDERSKSMQLRSDIDSLIVSCASKIRKAWNKANQALSNVAGTVEAKRKIKEHLREVQEEQYKIEKCIAMLRKAIEDKTTFIKVAHTRLEERSHRRAAENCYDAAQRRIVAEVEDIKCSLQTLHYKLRECESHLQQLLKTRSFLEINLQIKAHTLLIDQEKCLGMRRSYPVLPMVKL